MILSKMSKNIIKHFKIDLEIWNRLYILGLWNDTKFDASDKEMLYKMM